MFVDDEPLSSARPFWFVSRELLTSVLDAEINAVMQALAKCPDLRSLFDAPEATVPERNACFEVLAHSTLMESIYETFAGRYEESPSLGDAEVNVLGKTQNLVAADSPPWVLEIREVVARLPLRIYDALPEPLRTGGYDANNSAQVESIRSAAKTLSSVEQIRALTEGVIDQQLQRLERRWSATIPAFNQPHQPQPDQSPITKPSRPKGVEGLVRKHDLSQYSHYMDTLTEKQRLAFSLKIEYELKLSKIASRMGINRKTADEHIKAAEKKINQARSNEKHKANRTKSTPEF